MPGESHSDRVWMAFFVERPAGRPTWRFPMTVKISVLVAFGVYLLAPVLVMARHGRLHPGMTGGWFKDRYVLVHVTIFVLAMDF